MNGPEHYRRAEALLDACQPPHSVDYDDQGRDVELYPALEDGVDSIGNSLRAAQVHATLALVAAQVSDRYRDPARQEFGHSDVDRAFYDATR